MTDSFDRIERQLGLTLAAWGAASVLAGTTIRLAASDAKWRAFGTQTAIWGATDIAIAGIAHLRANRRGRPTDHRDRKRLHRLLLLNSCLDVGYISAGVTLTRRADSISARTGDRRSPRQLHGDGAAVVIQGVALLILDSSYAWKVREPL